MAAAPPVTAMSLVATGASYQLNHNKIQNSKLKTFSVRDFNP
jgi:hypothetical protein